MRFAGKLSTTTDFASGIDLGMINRISAPMTGDLQPMKNPNVPSREQEFYDMDGAELSITIEGEWIASFGQGWADAIAWMESIYGLITGSQYDDNQSRYLAIYEPDHYGSGVHLWLLRDDMTLAQNSSSNAPVHVIVESFRPVIKAGESPAISYTLDVKQQVHY